MGEQMTRIQVSDAVWRKFRAIAIERGVPAPVLLGSVVTGYVTRADKRRRIVRAES
jgi:hypothetical protein